MDNIEKGYFITHQSSPSTSNHWPVTSSTDYAILTSFINNHDERFGIQTCVYKNGESYIRRKWISWGEWEELSENIPSFYKDYNDIAALAAGVGTMTIVHSSYDSYTTQGTYWVNGDLVEVFATSNKILQRITYFAADQSVSRVAIRGYNKSTQAWTRALPMTLKID